MKLIVAVVPSAVVLAVSTAECNHLQMNERKGRTLGEDGELGDVGVVGDLGVMEVDEDD